MKTFKQYLSEVAPPGWSGTVTAMKKHHPDIKNPYALAWSMKNNGNKPHYEETPDKKTIGKRKIPKKKKKYLESQEPLWKRRNRLPTNRQVGIAANAIHHILDKIVSSINRESDYFWEIILNSDPEQVDSLLTTHNWRPFDKREIPGQTDIKYINREYPNVSCTHWFGRNGHQIDIESLDGIDKFI